MTGREEAGRAEDAHGGRQDVRVPRGANEAGCCKPNGVKGELFGAFWCCWEEYRVVQEAKGAEVCENRVCLFQRQLEETLSVEAGRDCRIIIIRWHKQIGVGRESCIGVLKGPLKLNGEGQRESMGCWADWA